MLDKATSQENELKAKIEHLQGEVKVLQGELQKEQDYNAIL